MHINAKSKSEALSKVPEANAPEAVKSAAAALIASAVEGEIQFSLNYQTGNEGPNSYLHGSWSLVSVPAKPAATA